MTLTKRQKEILDFLRYFIDVNDYAPSFEEIRDEFGYASLATVHEHLSNLERKGYIRKSYRGSRSIGFPEQPAVSLSLPLLGTVAAGLPVEAVEDRETVLVPEELVRPGRDHYVLRVAGQSMIDEQIRDGDYIVVEQRDTARDGETVVALVDDEAATVKKLYREPPDRIRLQPANPDMKPIMEHSDAVRVQGVVVGLIRKY